MKKEEFVEKWSVLYSDTEVFEDIKEQIADDLEEFVQRQKSINKRLILSFNVLSEASSILIKGLNKTIEELKSEIKILKNEEGTN